MICLPTVSAACLTPLRPPDCLAHLVSETLADLLRQGPSGFLLLCFVRQEHSLFSACFPLEKYGRCQNCQQCTIRRPQVPWYVYVGTTSPQFALSATAFFPSVHSHPGFFPLSLPACRLSVPRDGDIFGHQIQTLRGGCPGINRAVVLRRWGPDPPPPFRPRRVWDPPPREPQKIFRRKAPEKMNNSGVFFTNFSKKSA